MWNGAVGEARRSQTDHASLSTEYSAVYRPIHACTGLAGLRHTHIVVYCVNYSQARCVMYILVNGKKLDKEASQ